MKQTMKFLAIVVLSAAIAFSIAYVVTDTLRQFAAVGIFGGMFIALLMGAFDSRDKTRYESIKHKVGRNYGQAAIFVGTACLFMGTPKECEELIDDLWHRGVQAEMSELTGEEEFEIL